MEYEGRLPVNSLWAQQIPEETVRGTVRMITDYDDFCLRGYALNDDMDQALARTTASTGGRCQCVVTAKCSPWERAVIATAGIWKRKCSIFCRNIEKGSHSAGANVTSGADDAKGAGRALSSFQLSSQRRLLSLGFHQPQAPKVSTTFITWQFFRSPSPLHGTPRAVSSEQPRANPAAICSYSLPSSPR